MLKLYCYTDETGQDTKGEMFLVSVLLTEKDDLEALKEKILEIERKTKGSKKWTKTSNRNKILLIFFIKYEKPKNFTKSEIFGTPLSMAELPPCTSREGLGLSLASCKAPTN